MNTFFKSEAQQTNVFSEYAIINDLKINFVSVEMQKFQAKKCYFGKLQNDECEPFLQENNFSGEMKLVSEFTYEEQELVWWRSGLEKNSDAVICAQHEIQLLKKYSVINFKKCCNIFQMHEVGASAKPLPQSRRTVGLEMAKKLKEYGFEHVVPGQRLCSRCFTKAGKVDRKVESSTSEESESSVSSEIQSAIQSTEKATCSSNLDNSFALLNESPLAPLHSIPKRQKIKVCERKLGKVKRKLTSQLAVVSGLEPDDLDTDMSGKQEVSELKNNNKKLQEQSSDLNCLMQKLKAKFQKTENYSDKLQILTLVPQSWSAEKASTYFECSIYSIYKARMVEKEEGILGHYERKQRTGISALTQQKVLDFYEDEKTSRMLPGMKDKVSIQKNVYH